MSHQSLHRPGGVAHFGQPLIDRVAVVAGALEVAVAPRNARGREDAVAGVLVQVLAGVQLQPTPTGRAGDQPSAGVYEFGDRFDLPRREPGHPAADHVEVAEFVDPVRPADFVGLDTTILEQPG